MRKLIPMTAVALCVLAAPAFAQDEEGPDFGRLMEKAQELLKKIEEKIQPLLEKIQETVQEIMGDVEEWMRDLDPGEMFGEFDFSQWMDELRRMLEGLRGGEDDDDEDTEDCLIVEC